MQSQIQQMPGSREPFALPVTSHFCGIVIPQIFGRGEGRRMWALTVEYFDMSEAQRPVRGNNMIKFPGGNGEEGESMIETLNREFCDEVLRPGIEPSYEDSIAVHHHDCHDEHAPGGTHRKQFFLIANLDWEGKLRDQPRLEPDGNILGQPVWRQMKHLVAHEFMHRGHQYALKAAIDRLAQNPDMYTILRADLLVP